MISCLNSAGSRPLFFVYLFGLVRPEGIGGDILSFQNSKEILHAIPLKKIAWESQKNNHKKAR